MGKLYEELKRRKVFRVAAVYAVAAWVLIQVADTILPALQLPDWTVTFFTVLFIFGFPIAVILAWAYELTPQGTQVSDGNQPSHILTTSTDRKLTYATFIVVLLAVGFQISDRFVFNDSRAADEQVFQQSLMNPVRLTIETPEDAPLEFTGAYPDITISPDGEQVIYVSFDRQTGDPQLNRRNLVDLEVTPLPGGESHEGAVFSPDSESIAFIEHPAHNILKKVATIGGMPETIVRSPYTIWGLSWSADNQIIFGSRGNGLFSVSVEGGDAEPLTTINTDENEESHLWPFIIDSRKAVLFMIRNSEVATSDGQLAVLDLVTSKIKKLGITGTGPKYVSTGHLVYATSEGSIRAVPFDIDQLTVTGNIVSLVEGASVKSNGATNFDVSEDGHLVYAIGEVNPSGPDRILVQVDREGREEPLDFEPNQYAFPRYSTDGTRIAVGTTDATNMYIWVLDLARGSRSPVTFSGSNSAPVWMPTEDRLTFADGGVPNNTIVLASSNGSGTTDTLLTSGGLKYPTSWTRDGEVLAFYEHNPQTARDLWIFPLGGDPEPILVTPFDESLAVFSPDGNWLAYRSNKSGRNEIYVRPYPGPGPELTVSTEGGSEAVWSPNGLELFYRTPTQMMAVTIDTTNGISAGIPQTLFGDSYLRRQGYANYDIAPDGEHFVMVSSVSEAQGRLVLVVNWFTELLEQMESN